MGSHADEAVSEARTVAQALGKLFGSDREWTRRILEDIPYVLQGVSTSLIAFRSSRHQLVLPRDIPPPLAVLVHQLLEPAILYRALSDLVRHPIGVGFVLQSLQRAIERQLQAYQLVVGEIQRRERAGDTSLNLGSCQVMLSEPTVSLRVLYAIVQECQASNLVGGEVLSLLHQYRLHGDPHVQKLACDLLSEAEGPFLEIEQQWMQQGTLQDPHGEFYIVLQDESSPWVGRFALRRNQIPSSIDEKHAKYVMDLGKARYFARALSCDPQLDPASGLATPAYSSTRSSESIRAFSTSTNSMVDNACAVNAALASHDSPSPDEGASILKYVSDLLAYKHKLRAHIAGIRDFLLLSRGDFADSLIRGAWSGLREPAATLAHVTLVDILGDAVEESSARDASPEVLASLDASIFDRNSPDAAWEVFTIDYRVEAPLDVIVDKLACRIYLRLFKQLWDLRWSSFALATARSVAESIKLAELRHEAACFINTLLTNAYLFVIAPAWDRLDSKLPPAKVVTIDGIRAAHSTYLEELEHGILLGGSLSMEQALRELVDLALTLNTYSDHAGLDDDLVDTIHVKLSDVMEQILAELGSSESEILRAIVARF